MLLLLFLLALQLPGCGLTGLAVAFLLGFLFGLDAALFGEFRLLLAALLLFGRRLGSGFGLFGFLPLALRLRRDPAGLGLARLSFDTLLPFLLDVIGRDPAE